jgi:hypothetical protein
MNRSGLFLSRKITQSRAVGSAEKCILVGWLVSQRKLFLKYVHVFGVSALLPDLQMNGAWIFFGIIEIEYRRLSQKVPVKPQDILLNKGFVLARRPR